MEAIRGYALRVICAALICGILTDLSEKFGFQKQIRLACSIYFAFVLTGPILSARLPAVSQWEDIYLPQAQEAAAQGEEIRIRSMAAIIRQECEAYILKEAKAMGADVEVEIELDNGYPPAPAAVTLRGAFDASAETRLGRLLADELGIPKEHQTWIRQQSHSSGSS